MKIMICCDGSDNAHRARDKAIEYFKPHKPEVIMMTVVEQPLDASMENEDIFEAWRRERHDELRECAQWVADHGLEVDAIMAIGDPRRMVLDAIEKRRPDLVVVARRGKSEMEKMVLGSVSAFLVRHSPCPLLVMT